MGWILRRSWLRWTRIWIRTRIRPWTRWTPSWIRWIPWTRIPWIRWIPWTRILWWSRIHGKRSADAEPEAKADADPFLVYGGLGYAGHHGLGYAGYAGYRGLGYYGVGGYYGKRSADAEAEADPYYTYGHYGLGYAGH